MTYQEQLCDPRWIEKRERILSRDLGMCQKCMRGSNLHVHHTYYTDGKMAWDYPDSALITYCSACHKEEHRIDDNSEDWYVTQGKIIGSAASGILGLMKKQIERGNHG